MIIFLLAAIVLILFVWTIIVHYPKKRQQFIYSNGIARTAYPSSRPEFNVWMRYIRLRNHRNLYK